MQGCLYVYKPDSSETITMLLQIKLRSFKLPHLKAVPFKFSCKSLILTVYTV